MKMYPEWQFDEMKQVGTDYTDFDTVLAYDERMRKLRDIKRETAEIISWTGLSKEQTLLELGSGTGEFALEAAKHCARVIAVDVSLPMLELARSKALEKGLENIEFHHAGFLTYLPSGKPPHVVVSQLALHHLPDFWKAVALQRIYNVLMPSGKLFLRDTVYSFKTSDYESFFSKWVLNVNEKAGPETSRDLLLAICEEYTTLSWVMEGLLARVGFQIEKSEYRNGFLALYLCKKV